MKQANEKVTVETSLLAGQGVQQVPQLGVDLFIIAASLTDDSPYRKAVTGSQPVQGHLDRPHG
jgi:hypothetical protein